MKYQEPIYSVR